MRGASRAGGVLIDEQGNSWSDTSAALAERMGYRGPKRDLTRFAVLHFGYIHLRRRRGGIYVRVHAGHFTAQALTGALYVIFDATPPRILLAVLVGGEWRYELFTNPASFSRRAETLVLRPPSFRHQHRCERNFIGLA
ncbi:MAG TPA: hypothetical protein VKT70_08865 [Stellaceae bacterium]|nr:hypothetical protein [Stellaceae bacterium]